MRIMTMTTRMRRRRRTFCVIWIGSNERSPGKGVQHNEEDA